MWRKEYFTNLIELDKAKVSENSKPIEVGDIIVVYAENKKRALENSSWWKVIIKGRDEIVRGAGAGAALDLFQGRGGGYEV